MREIKFRAWDSKNKHMKLVKDSYSISDLEKNPDMYELLPNGKIALKERIIDKTVIKAILRRYINDTVILVRNTGISDISSDLEEKIDKCSKEIIKELK